MHPRGKWRNCWCISLCNRVLERGTEQTVITLPNIPAVTIARHFKVLRPNSWSMSLYPTNAERKKALEEKYNIDLGPSTIREVTILTDLLKEEFENGMDAGKAEGRAIGIAEGRAIGIAEGIAEGRAEGRIEQCVETVIHLLRDENLPRETAIRYANVPDECRTQILSEVDRRLNAA